MNLPSLVDESGRAIILDQKLGEGAEGTVYSIKGDPDHVVKVYIGQRPTTDDIEKLKGMTTLANPKLLSVSAWPKQLAKDATSRRIVGFTMPRLSGFSDIWVLSHPIERIKSFPRAGWAFQVRTAANLAAAFDEVHQTGVVVGDVQRKNAQVSGKALVRLVDCDSFQVKVGNKQFFCNVGLPHYIPPELQGKPLRGFIRNVNHDRFGLAVLIYELLFVGRHPYMGIYSGKGDPSFEELIAEYRFAQGPQSRTWGMEPPPHTPLLRDVPEELGSLFRRAFERGSQNGTRPSAREWLTAIKRLEPEIAVCGTDAGHQYWKGAGSCVWCRIESKGGPEYFFGVSQDTSEFVLDEETLKKLEEKLWSAQRVLFPERAPRCDSPTLPEPEPIPGDCEEHNNIKVVLKYATICCFLAMPLGFVRPYLFAFAFTTACVMGIWLLIVQRTSPAAAEYRRRRMSRNDALYQVESLERDWKQAVREYQATMSKREHRFQEIASQCRGIPRSYRDSLNQLSGGAEAAAKTRFLRLHLISDADIPKIGAGRKQALSAYGVFSAAEVSWGKIRGIPGFGDALTSAVVAWRDHVLTRFRFDPKSAISSQAHKALIMTCRSQQQKLFAELKQQLAKMDSCVTECKGILSKIHSTLVAAMLEYEQKESDFRLMAKH